MLRHKPDEAENDGSKRLLTVACRAVEHNLDDETAVAMIREYERTHPFPRAYDDGEIITRLRDAGRKQRRILPMTDMGNAERFAQQHVSDLRYCHAWGKWLVWDGQRWAIDESGEVMRRAKRTARSIKKDVSETSDPELREQLSAWATASERNRSLLAMVSLARSEQPFPIGVDALDSYPWLLNCSDGTIDLRTGTLQAHRQTDFLTKLTPVSWSSEPPEMWLRFLDRIFGGNRKLVDYIQRLMGLSLVGDVLEHTLPIFYGRGSNGKSTLLEVWRATMGEYAASAPEGFLIQSKQKQHPTELAMLHGKRFIAAEETDDSGRLSESHVKAITGGTKISARRMREDYWEFTPSHTIVLATNYKPLVKGTDHGIWRRIHLVPFTVTISESEMDKELKNKLINEAPQILYWMVQGCLAWQRQGLDLPREVAEATECYRTDSDILGGFVSECCNVAEGLTVQADELYSEYKRWAAECGQKVWSRTRFGLRISENFAKKKRNDASYYLGISLR
jgi:putative DNA primase/helicase